MESNPPVLSLTIPVLFGYGFGIVQVSSGQKNTIEKNMAEVMSIKKNQTNNMILAMNVSGPIPSLATPGVKTFHVYTSEIADVDEEKLNIAGSSFSVNTLSVNKGDYVTVNFYNVKDIQTEKHSFTIGDPYKVDIDVAFTENGNVTFTANNQGIFPCYCKYHLPVMVGQLVVLPL